jgi:hypothetical protein
VELRHVGTLDMFCHVESVIGWQKLGGRRLADRTGTSTCARKIAGLGAQSMRH